MVDYDMLIEDNVYDNRSGETKRDWKERKLDNSTCGAAIHNTQIADNSHESSNIGIEKLNSEKRLKSRKKECANWQTMAMSQITSALKR